MSNFQQSSHLKCLSHKWMTENAVVLITVFSECHLGSTMSLLKACSLSFHLESDHFRTFYLT